MPAVGAHSDADAAVEAWRDRAHDEAGSAPPVRMAGSAAGKRGEAARGVGSPPKTPAVLSVTASSPVTSRDGRRFRRLLWSSPRASSCGEKSPPPGDTPAASTSRSSEEEGESTEGGAGDSTAAPGVTGHCTGTQLTAARGAARPGSLTPVSPSNDA